MGIRAVDRRDRITLMQQRVGEEVGIGNSESVQQRASTYVDRPVAATCRRFLGNN